MAEVDEASSAGCNIVEDTVHTQSHHSTLGMPIRTCYSVMDGDWPNSRYDSRSD